MVMLRHRRRWIDDFDIHVGIPKASQVLRVAIAWNEFDLIEHVRRVRELVAIYADQSIQFQDVSLFRAIFILHVLEV